MRCNSKVKRHYTNESELSDQSTLASGTMPFRRVAATSYSGASLLQWPHLRGKKSETGHEYLWEHQAWLLLCQKTIQALGNLEEAVPWVWNLMPPWRIRWTRLQLNLSWIFPWILWTIPVIENNLYMCQCCTIFEYQIDLISYFEDIMKFDSIVKPTDLSM